MENRKPKKYWKKTTAESLLTSVKRLTQLTLTQNPETTKENTDQFD